MNETRPICRVVCIYPHGDPEEPLTGRPAVLLSCGHVKSYAPSRVPTWRARCDDCPELVRIDRALVGVIASHEIAAGGFVGFKMLPRAEGEQFKVGFPVEHWPNMHARGSADAGDLVDVEFSPGPGEP